MAPAQEVSDHYQLSRAYLETASDSLAKGRLEPALFNGYHALELACKAAILAEAAQAPRTHHVGGTFGRLFRGRVRAEDVRRINEILAKYNLPRYPGTPPWNPKAAARDLAFIRYMIEDVVPKLLPSKGRR